MAVAVYRMPGQPLAYGLLIALYTVACYAGRRQRLFVLVLVLAGISVAALLRSEAPINYAFPMLVHAGAYALGSMARLRQAYTAELQDRARRLERERAAHVERAKAAERARIAHDMHDVLAHAVSLMVVQAEAGPRPRWRSCGGCSTRSTRIRR
ncbi:MAG: histidine kinase, partial [Thermocrispum sp.]